MDLTSVRAEIKAWEHEFRSTHARDPTVQEIKDRPEIAAKYRLYKSLSKAVASAPVAGSSTTRLTTPPRPQPRQTTQPPASLLPKTRAVRVDPPTQTYNPFSPVKKKKVKHDDIHDDIQPLNLTHLSSRLNPFTTPTKPRTQPKHKPSARRSPSPDPFPLIQLSQPARQSSGGPHTPTAHSAVTRARKRLRGDPVSPSPVKEKRARIGSQRARNVAAPIIDSDDEEVTTRGLGVRDADETFIEATPMKPPPGGKSFRVLFDEVPPHAERASRQPAVRTLSRTKSTLSKTNLSFTSKGKSRALSPSSSEDDDSIWDRGAKLKSLITSTNDIAGAKKLNTQQRRMINEAAKHAIPKAVLPGKDDLWSDVGPSKGPQTKNQARIVLNNKEGGDATTRSATKRPLPDEEPDARSDQTNGLTDGGNLLPRLALLPPSPPPADSSSRSYGSGSKDKAKGRAAVAFGRKKARLLEQAGGEDDDDSSLDDEEESVKVREITRQRNYSARAKLPDDLDDSEFDWPPYPVHAPESPRLEASALESGIVDVDLPDDLKRILALSPRRRSEIEEDKLVKGLLYGRRETHYDAKGGEIWDVGEIIEASEGAGEGTEEEWEGEPVPWEVGEL
ncbi:hypothetical protein POSPLADRAFT_1051460 [Postia placenta MAD-698-R-SB12]|uniref:DNA replication regulator SLD2 n=1 Tax=Postia placenta MAD-698-R-SB12 TaxID=670580 RepID=A0A1X6NF96_9APHY|nr:hypothetical protein POSPLADRAFT_1051460 [Postia placenta MAD-698-R-SB12]OSX67315.1 hypothetical protein POSPLADRAFT_1051460 [Postia placenta MAD-698-R-SB12]